MTFTSESLFAIVGILAAILSVGVIYGKVTTQLGNLSEKVEIIQNNVTELTKYFYTASADCDVESCPLRTRARTIDPGKKFTLRETED
jgi:hypothetical protein